VVAYVAVKTDLTRERTLEARLLGQHRRHSSVLELMKSVRLASTLEATVAGFCEAVTEVDDMDVVRVLLVDPDGGMAPVGFAGAGPSGWANGVPLDLATLGQLLDRTRTGAWWFALRAPTGPQGFSADLTTTMVAAGFTSAALAPIRWEGRMVAVLVVATRSSQLGEWTASRLETLEEIGSYAGTLFGDQIAHHVDREQTRVRIHEIIEEHRFHPVFQPIVDLRTGSVFGYEALTRFDDGRRPDLRYADAHAVGLGPQLELVTALAAIRAAESLPDDVGLSVNLSPAAILEGHAATLVSAAGRPITVEITEHAEIENYPAVRRALSAVDGLRVSIDDAGAGFASLRHILELQPDVVKLDIGIVRGIDADPARQALAAGLRHFSGLTDTVLIAEGVETEAEAEALRRLDIEFAQGYLYGRPEPLPGD
jgi:EAL domain-containing protein (putative c-di-GMP-specific phosphodiesterase class I)